MKKAIYLLVMIMLLSCISCTNTNESSTGDSPAAQVSAVDPNAPAAPTGDDEREVLGIFLDGKTMKEAGYVYADIKSIMTGKKIDGVYYYGASVAAITKQDLSSVNGAFLEGTDGYISYVSNINDVYLAAYTFENGEYQSVVMGDKAVYGGAVAGGIFNKGVVNVYLVTTFTDFKVEIQKNGKKIGELTMNDFMKKTPVNEKKVATGMFDGSFLYNSGQSTYEGRFLGIDYETMLAKLSSLNMDLSGTITNVEYYGTNGLGKTGINKEYSSNKDNDKYFGAVDFYCMFDGMTYNNVTSDYPIGLTAFINGTGSRWMTFNLTTINFVTE